jgi:Abortive infection C-terminus
LTRSASRTALGVPKASITRRGRPATSAYAQRRAGVDGRFDPLYFGASLTEADIEISEDMFLLTAEEARKHVEPPRPLRLQVVPSLAQAKPSTVVVFAVRGFDQHDRPITINQAEWSASAGSTDLNGRFTAPEVDGRYTVTVSAAGLAATAHVDVTSGADVPPPPPPTSTTVFWGGDVPPQKWMNFYTKVLSRFATMPGLKVHVSFELPADAGVSESKVGDMKTALRELGLSDPRAALRLVRQRNLRRQVRWLEERTAPRPLPAATTGAVPRTARARPHHPRTATVNRSLMETLADTLDRLQTVLITRATGTGCDPNEYQYLRAEVMENPLVADLVPRWLRNNRTCDEFWQFIKYERQGYQPRREFIWQELRPLFDRVEGAKATPADTPISDTLARFDTESVHALWTQALTRRETNPEGAITLARTLLETVCKHILDDLGLAYSRKDDLPDLYHAASSALNLAPSQHSEKTFKQILGGAASIVQGLGSIRNTLSDAHGTGKHAARPLPRHAELAINLWLWPIFRAGLVGCGLTQELDIALARPC